MHPDDLMPPAQRDPVQEAHARRMIAACCRTPARQTREEERREILARVQADAKLRGAARIRKEAVDLWVFGLALTVTGFLLWYTALADRAAFQQERQRLHRSEMAGLARLRR